MRTRTVSLIGILALAPLSSSAPSQTPAQKMKAAEKPTIIPPAITSATAEYQYPNAINLVVPGRKFKVGIVSTKRAIRTLGPSIK